MESRAELERKHPGKVSEIETRFIDHVMQQHPGYDIDALRKWHMQDLQSRHHDRPSNTMIDTAKQQGWL